MISVVPKAFFSVNKPQLTILGLVAATICGASANVELPSIFGDHMVLQQGVPLPVWGTADAGEQVKVSFAGQEATAAADPQGRWKLKLEAIPASGQGRDFVVAGKNKVVFTDVLVGEVWVCSGQSNMVVSQRNAISKEVEANKQVRFFNTPRTAYLEPQATTKGKWVLCRNDTWLENQYSAVGYFFAEDLQKSRNVPVGMIESAWGGTAIAPWIDLAALEKSESFNKLAAQVKGQFAKLPEMTAKYEKEILPAWEEKHKSEPAPKAESEDGSTGPGSAEAKPDKGKPSAGPKRPPVPGRDSGNPTALFNGMVNPHIPYAIKGALWYQGESNAQNEERSKEYAGLLQLLITGWREKWGQGDFPFFIVQLPFFTVDRPWMTLRNSQFKALSLPNTGMAVTVDLNPTDNLHPPRKQAVGERLALLARNSVYGEDLVASGPVFQSMKIEGSKIRVTFSDTGGGLVLGGPPPSYRKPNEDPSSEKSLLGFQICGADGVWGPATAEIDGKSVLVSSDAVPHPVQASYAHANYPKANLYNKEGLPAAPFRTDDLPDFLKSKP